MKRLCPRGHRVIIVQEGANKHRGHCEECECFYPRSFLIPVVSGVRRNQHQLYAAAFREGYKAAVRLQLEREDLILEVGAA